MNHRKKRNLGKWRLLIQTGAFLVILLAPFLNHYFQIDFIQGWYQSLGIGKLWFVSPLEGLESILVSKIIYLPLLIGMIIPILVALFLGRIFCGWICPINYFCDLSDRFGRLFTRRRFRRDRLVLSRKLLWYALMGEILLTLILGAPIFVFISPPGLIGREIMMAVFFHTFALEGVVILGVLAVNLVTRRFYCRYMCPLGALLAFIGNCRKLRVVQDQTACNECGLCDRTCPLGLNPSLGEGMSAYCWNCGECVDNCAHDAISFKWRR